MLFILELFNDKELSIKMLSLYCIFAKTITINGICQHKGANWAPARSGTL